MDHKITYPPVHDWDCQPCAEKYEAAKQRCAAIPNPHRFGTKVFMKFERERYAGLRAIDPRSELYWSM